MKTHSVILLLLLALLATGCGIYGDGYGFDYKQLNSIERGMSFKEVSAILGEPVLRDLNDEGEAWGFRANGLLGGSIVKVWFKDGKVTEMKSYLEDSYPVESSKKEKALGIKKNDSDKNTGTKVVVGPDGKHYIDSGSVVISSDGKHYIKTGSVVVTPEGKHIVIP